MLMVDFILVNSLIKAVTGICPCTPSLEVITYIYWASETTIQTAHTNLKTAKAASPRERHETHIGWGVGGLGLVHYKCSILQVRSPLKLHLPEFLQGFYYIH